MDPRFLLLLAPILQGLGKARQSNGIGFQDDHGIGLEAPARLEGLIIRRTGVRSIMVIFEMLQVRLMGLYPFRNFLDDLDAGITEPDVRPKQPPKQHGMLPGIQTEEDLKMVGFTPIVFAESFNVP
jgi:hypothetical protein